MAMRRSAWGCLLALSCSFLLCNAAPYGDPLVLAQIAERPSRCPGQCREFGTCNEELGRCDCPRFRDGPDCSVLLNATAFQDRCQKMNFRTTTSCQTASSFNRGNFSQCINDCNWRGKCLGGFCHCLPGHYGTDCAKSLDASGRPQLLQGTGYTTRAKRPWIYVYDLPPELNAWPFVGTLDRPQYSLFWQRLLGSGAQTADPDKADWFFIPISMRTDGLRQDFVKTVDYIKQTWPFWDQRGGGNRHFIFHTGDTGRIGQGLRSLAGYENISFLQHWGIYKDRPTGRKWKAAHRPGKDIVIPSVQSFIASSIFATSFTPSRFLMHGLDDRFNDTDRRPLTFFFAGRICGERTHPTEAPWPYNCKDATGYSGGIRQRVFAEHHNRSGYVIVTRLPRISRPNLPPSQLPRMSGRGRSLAYYELHNRTNYFVSTHTPNYVRYLKSSKFCLSPLGGACGDRQIVVTVAGCLPVVIGDDVYNYFEPEMDWRPFSVMLKEEQVPEIPNIIEKISVEERKRMQTAMKCATHHLMHGTSVGGILDESGRYDAFETTLEILRAQADHPGTPPQDYSKIDPEFKRFMACGADEIGQEPPPDPKPDYLCHHNRPDHKKCTGAACFRWASPVLGPPGGAICCGHRDLSTCPRLWD